MLLRNNHDRQLLAEVGIAFNLYPLVKTLYNTHTFHAACATLLLLAAAGQSCSKLTHWQYWYRMLPPCSAFLHESFANFGFLA